MIRFSGRRSCESTRRDPPKVALVQLNFAAREVAIKLVYYGPALSGKTTNLKALHQLVQEKSRGRLMTLETKDDRTLFFDMLPLVFKADSEHGQHEPAREGLHRARPGRPLVDAAPRAPGRRRHRVRRRLAGRRDREQRRVVPRPPRQPEGARALDLAGAARHPVQQARPPEHPDRRRDRRARTAREGARVQGVRSERARASSRASSACSTARGSASTRSTTRATSSASGPRRSSPWRPRASAMQARRRRSRSRRPASEAHPRQAERPEGPHRDRAEDARQRPRRRG